MKRSKELNIFIQKNSRLFWFIPPERILGISDEILVETILNYGDKDDFTRLVRLMGINKVARLFFDSINSSERKKGNYSEITINYFSHVFSKYAH